MSEGDYLVGYWRLYLLFEKSQICSACNARKDEREIVPEHLNGFLCDENGKITGGKEDSQNINTNRAHDSSPGGKAQAMGPYEGRYKTVLSS